MRLHVPHCGIHWSGGSIAKNSMNQAFKCDVTLPFPQRRCGNAAARHAPVKILG
jgi:hypothetical protein